MTNAQAFDARALAREHQAFIEHTLDIQLDEHRCFTTLKAVYKMAQGLIDGERLPRTNKIRFDHYRSCVRFMAVAMLWTDKATNTIVAKDTKSAEHSLTCAGNSFFQHKLGMERSTLDHVIATVKKLGWYASCERWKYSIAAGRKLYRAKTSVKSVFIGFYDFFGMGVAIANKVAKAKEFARELNEKANRKLMREMFSETGSKQGYDKFGYGMDNLRRHNKRQERGNKATKEALSAKVSELKQATNVVNQANHSENLQTQIWLASKGMNPEQIKAYMSSQSFKNGDDIPY